MADAVEGKLCGLPPIKKARVCNTEEKVILVDTEDKNADSLPSLGMNAEQSLSSSNSDFEYSKDSVEDEIEHDSIGFTEKTFGIEEFLSVEKGINGIIKQRYSDFIVREIDQDGNIVKLLSTELPEKAQGEQIKVCHEEGQKIKCPVNEDELRKIELFSIKLENEKADKNDFLVLNIDNDKEHRKLVHLFVKERFKNLDTETTHGPNGDKIVKVFYRKSGGGKRFRSQLKDEKKFCLFTLYKENRDTMGAINLIARLLHVKPSAFSYAGTKDKRAITTQKVCACNVDARKICTLNKLMKNVAVGDFHYTKCALKLGSLSGNHFSIVLRNIASHTDESTISPLMQSLRQNGFINYFGMQRFGSGGAPTFEIGKQVLSSCWDNVIKLILTPRPGEDSAICKAKEHWLSTNDSKAAYEMIKKRKCIEGQILDVLASQGDRSYYNAFQHINRNMRLMYVHSYQSFIWNKIVSRRLQTFGINPIAGDLVIDKNVKKEESEGASLDSMTRCKVKAITDDDIANGTYRMTDVVLPLPGYDITYPSNAINDWYSELLSNDGIDKDNMHHQIKDYSLSGAYRYMIVRPNSLKYTIVNYDDHCIPLLLSDVDIMSSKVLQNSSSGRYKALVLEFSLPPASYATMLIREVTKLDTSTHSNMKLNNLE